MSHTKQNKKNKITTPQNKTSTDLGHMPFGLAHAMQAAPLLQPGCAHRVAAVFVLPISSTMFKLLGRANSSFC